MTIVDPGVVSAEREPAACTPVVRWQSTGADVLAFAVTIVPEVSSRLPGYADIQAVLYEALCRLEVGKARHHRLQMADEVRDLLAVYLVATGKARPEQRFSTTVRGWVVNRDLTGVEAALAGAARFWRRELDPLAGASAERSI